MHLGISVGDPGAGGRVRQGTASLNSRGIAFGYQHDVFSNSVADTYRAAIAGGKQGVAGGLAIALYRGHTKATGWDAGVTVARTPAVAVGGVLANLGQPVVRGEQQPTTLVPSVTLHPFGPALALSGLGRLTVDSALGFAAAARLVTPGRTRLGLSVRVDLDRSFHRTGLTFGLALGGPDQLGVVASTMTGTSGIATGDVYGVSTRNAGR